MKRATGVESKQTGVERVWWMQAKIKRVLFI